MRSISIAQTQKGSVLLITLAVIILLTIWGIAAVKSTSFMLQGNHNARLKQISVEAAEYALRQAENLVRAQVNSKSDIVDLFTGANGHYSQVRDVSRNLPISLLPIEFNYRDPSHWLDGNGNVRNWPAEDDRPGFSAISIVYDDRADSVTRMVKQPLAVIEYMGRDRYDVMSSNGGYGPDPQAKEMFRVTVIGWGPQGISSTVLRSHVALAIR